MIGGGKNVPDHEINFSYRLWRKKGNVKTEAVLSESFLVTLLVNNSIPVMLLKDQNRLIQYPKCHTPNRKSAELPF